MKTSPSKVAGFLDRLQHSLEEEQVVVSVYALERAAIDLEWDHLAILDELKWLTASAFHRIEIGRDPRYLGEDIWVFCPRVNFAPSFEGSNLWIRMIERRGVIVISFHEA